MKRLYIISIALLWAAQLNAQCVSSDVWDVEDANAYCFEVNDNVRHIYANNYPDHDDNYNQPQFTVTAQDYEYYMCAYPEQDTDYTPLYETTETTVGCEYNYQFGVNINGVRYDPNSAVTFVEKDGSNNINWHEEAASTANDIGVNMGTDNGGHLNSKGEYHYHAIPYDYFVNDLGIDGSEHSPIVGYAADGFPIYYKYVYSDAEDTLSAIATASSGYTLKSGTRPGDGDTAPSGTYDGNYYEDYEYSSANTILDQCNGRYAATPDYPYGTYYYVLTDEYPYIPRCFLGTSVDNTFRIGPDAACPSSTASTSCAAVVTGCMDPFSDNYNSSANVDDGSCTYSTITWNGSWSNTSGPGDGNAVTISSDYTFSSDGKFTCDNLTVSSGATLTIDTDAALVVYGDITNNGDIIVESGGSLITYDGTSVTGNSITIKRNTRYSDGKYSFVGTPINQNANTIGANLGSSVYKYDETVGFADQGLSRWIDASSDQLVPGQGYTQAFQQEISFVGTPNDGDISIAGTFTDRTNDNVEGWVLVSNPYPAAISVYRFLNENTNLSGAVYFWDDNNSQSARGSNSDYIVANGIATTQSSTAGNEDRYNNHIGSAQGFFVKLNDGTDLNVDFTEAMRVSDSNSDDHFFRTNSSSIPFVRINLTNDQGLFKQTVVGWVNGISDAQINRIYDAPAMNYYADEALFTYKLDQAMSIQGISQSKKEVPLGLNLGKSGTYQLAFEFDHSSGQALLLKDNLTGQVVDMQESYTFSAEAGKIEDRFSLVTARTVLSTEETVQARIYAVDRTLYVQYPSMLTGDHLIRVYSLSGQLILNEAISSSQSIDLGNVSPGIYMVSDGVQSQKIILK